MIIATVASLSSRVRLLRRSVESLLPQVDGLCVYLNGHESIPDFLRHPKVMYAVLSNEAGWRGGEGKLWFWDQDAFKGAPAPCDGSPPRPVERTASAWPARCWSGSCERPREPSTAPGPLASSPGPRRAHSAALGPLGGRLRGRVRAA